MLCAERPLATILLGRQSRFVSIVLTTLHRLVVVLAAVVVEVLFQVHGRDNLLSCPRASLRPQ